MNSKWGTAVLAVAVLGGILLWMTARNGEAQSHPDVTYVCSETGKVVVAPAQQTPAVNPETGRRTLLRGVYCTQCDKWYTTPVADRAGGNPREVRCRVHDIPMAYDGPTTQ